MTCLTLAACSAQTESDSKGTCTLNCSQHYTAAGEFEVVPLIADGAEDINLACEADFAGQKKDILPTNLPVQVRFLVYEKIPPFGQGQDTSTTGDAAGGTTGGTTGGDQTATPLMTRVPRAGIGFEPWVNGLPAVEKTNPEFYDGKNVSPAKYAGVVTPSAEWCTDSCGVATYEVWPDCKQASSLTLQAGVAVSGIQASKVYTFTLTNGS